MPQIVTPSHTLGKTRGKSAADETAMPVMRIFMQPYALRRAVQLCAISSKVTCSDLVIPQPGIMRLHFAQIAVVADMVADPIRHRRNASSSFRPVIRGDHIERFENGAGVVFAAAEIVDFGDARGLPEFEHEAGDVFGVNIVADLFAFVAEDLVFAAFHVALDQVTEEAVEFHAGMAGSGEASAAQAAGGDIEIAAVFLHHDVAGDFGSAEDASAWIGRWRRSRECRWHIRDRRNPSASSSSAMAMVLGRSP